MILVDTNVLSETRLADGESRVRRRLASFGDDVFVSVIVLGEIVFGIERMPQGRRRRHIENFHRLIKAEYASRILPVTDDIAERWGDLRASHKRSGATLPLADGLIAATALAHDLTIMTRNTRDFELTGVRLINPWED